MRRAEILKVVDAEIERLRTVRRILAGNDGVAGKGGSRGRGQMSQEARDRIAAAQRARWAKVRAGQKKK